jgi:hypothetical protein
LQFLSLQFASYPLLLTFPLSITFEDSNGTIRFIKNHPVISRQLPGLTLRFIATLIREKDVPLERLSKDKAAPDHIAQRMHSLWCASH